MVCPLNKKFRRFASNSRVIYFGFPISRENPTDHFIFLILLSILKMVKFLFCSYIKTSGSYRHTNVKDFMLELVLALKILYSFQEVFQRVLGYCSYVLLNSNLRSFFSSLFYAQVIDLNILYIICISSTHTNVFSFNFSLCFFRAQIQYDVRIYSYSCSKDVNTVKKLVDDCLSSQLSSSLRPHDAVSALGPMYDSHNKSYLPKMQASHRTISNLVDFCMDKKNEMNIFVHNYMQQIAYIQCTIKNVRNKFSIFTEAVNCQNDQLRT